MILGALFFAPSREQQWSDNTVAKLEQFCKQGNKHTCNITVCRGDQDNWGQECNKVCNKIKDSISNLEEHVVVNQNRTQFQEMFQYGTGKCKASAAAHFNE